MEAGLSTGYDFGLDGFYADGFVSGPLSDTLGARLAVRYSKSDDMWRNEEVPGVQDKQGEDEVELFLYLSTQVNRETMSNGSYGDANSCPCD